MDKQELKELAGQFNGYRVEITDAAGIYVVGFNIASGRGFAQLDVLRGPGRHPGQIQPLLRLIVECCLDGDWKTYNSHFMRDAIDIVKL